MKTYNARRNAVLLTAGTVIFLITFSVSIRYGERMPISLGASPAWAQTEKQTPPLDLVDSVIDLYTTQGEPLDVNDQDDAKIYINLFRDDLDKLAALDLYSLDQDRKTKLDPIYNDYALAYTYYKDDPTRKDLDKAKEMYNVAINLNPNDTVPWVNLGTLFYADEENYAEALKCYDAALKIEPGNAIAGFYRDLCLDKIKEGKAQ